MSRFHELGRVDQADEVVTLTCSAKGELIAVNDDRGRVRLFSTAPVPGWLRFELDRSEVRAVLLHPDGQRVCALVGDTSPVVRIFDPHTGALLRTLDPGLTFADQDEDESEDPIEIAEDSHESLRRLHAAILDHQPPLTWLLIAEIANQRAEGQVPWLAEILGADAGSLLWPDRMSRLALHPNGRWLAVLDRGCFVIDLESAAVISTIDRELELGSLLEDGEGTHTLAIDERGALAIASTAISGNPFLRVERFDAATGEALSSTETWQQVWHDTHEVHVYDPTTFLPPHLIPVGEYVVVFRRTYIEVWSSAGLLRTIPLRPETCVIPSFDPGNRCRSARAFVIADEGFALLDLIAGQRTPCRPRSASGELLRAADIRWIEFVDHELVLWTDDELLATADGDRWSRCALPEGRATKLRTLGGSTKPLVAVVLDDHGQLWLGELELERAPETSPKLALVELEAELIAHPDQAESFAVYADALSERGDPRGELILLHLQGAQAQAQALIQRHAGTWLAGLSSLQSNSYALEWRLGFVRTAEFRVADREQLAEVLCFLGTDSARLLERLTVEFAERMAAQHRVDLQTSLDTYLSAANHWPLLRRRLES